MIVRNEAHVITEGLDSVRPYIDTWVIVDTGSTDGTQGVVSAYFDAHGIPGELHERPWRSFGENRTEALALARPRADYMWVMDADDRLVGSFDRVALTLDCHHLRFGPDFLYWRPQIFRADRRWEYRGVVHEYAACADPPFTEGRIDGAYHVESRRLGDRSRSPDKYRRDAELLLDALRENPDDPRTIFYLAQSYFDVGDAAEALRYYERRAAMGGWGEEVYWSRFRRAVCLERLGEPWPRCRDAYLAAWEGRPSRAEALHVVAERERKEGRHDAAYLHARAASEIPFPEGENLFVAADVYRWRSEDERSVSAYYAGRYRESLDLASRLLDNPHLPEAERERVEGNRDLAAARVLEQRVEDELPHPAQPAAPRPTQPAASPSVTLTITTCRRPQLFAATLDSFLTCCEDLYLISRFIVVDDGSSEEERAWMAARYPFVEFVWKTDADKGHARSMNVILDRLEETGSAFWLHLEDDWRFFARDRYVGKALAILDDDPTLGQVLFNRNYGETLADRATPGGVVRQTARDGVRYRLHEHIPPETPEYRERFRGLAPGATAHFYWPHYSLRPSLVRMLAVRDLGRYDPGAVHFEHEFALRWRERGWRSAFFDVITARHIGRLTSERGADAPPNAYDLNGQPQFVKTPPVPPTRVKILGAALAAAAGAADLRPGASHDGIVITDDPAEADYFVVFGEPAGDLGELVNPDRVIFVPTLPIGPTRPTRPDIARLVRGHQALERVPVRVLNLDRRPDRWSAFRRAAFREAGPFLARCERVSAVDGQSVELTPEIRHLFRGNDFHFRRGIVGCALSHLALWKHLAAGGDVVLVLEDDVRFEPAFLARMAEVLGELAARQDEVDLVLIGYHTWTAGQRVEVTRSRPLELRPMDWSSYLGGCHAYLLSPRGARTLVDLAERDGIQNGIDWFVMKKGDRLNVLQAVPQLASAPLAVPGGVVDSDIQHDFEPVRRSSLPAPGGRPVRVKLIGDWCTSEQLCREWNHMSQGNFRWNDIEVTWEDRDVDFYVIVNRALRGEYYDPARTIVFQMEPWCGLARQTWGVKTWGEWARPDPAKFLQVRAHATHLNNAFWQLKATYAELKTMRIEKTRLLSTICSSKYFDPGHIARVDFIRYIESRDDDVVRIDTYGWDNQLGFRSYRGPHPVGEKDAGILPYKYFFAAENNAEPNFITEKLWEPILTDTLCFYNGCPNASDHIDPRAFIALDLSDFPRAFDTMREAFLADEWARRVEIIRREKEKVLDEYQFFPTLERVILGSRDPS